MAYAPSRKLISTARMASSDKIYGTIMIPMTTPAESSENPPKLGRMTCRIGVITNRAK